ncbi:MAG TPA: hypothetical protein VM012_07555 [Flavitalea sp.]|nr:hypothetical protein [Flavitalea sp.]
MKLLLLAGTLFLVSLSTNAFPFRSAFSTTTLTIDICKDKDFIRIVNDVFTIQARIIETNSTSLMAKSVAGTINETEKKLLAAKLGYSSYTIMNKCLDGIGMSVSALKNKYTILNNQSSADLLITTSIDNLITEGKISGLNTGGTNNVCLTQLFKDICSCIQAGGYCTLLSDCVKAAYVKYNTCKTQPPPR